ncbi:RagB/SusD family nutrient uptake outer membrane protein [Parabacteroides hominis]|uniref:RagB/SusD family nutrient uptake outer membrane protein n=1 Tax=Parabacteroides hominis TaxID=2763057 RepID=A0ABR7DTS9_9BACT|nr:RagB/SusD family nutrient uptake outer membrane protein [Parabacteroides hominis]MBC5634825.1 RagB/SusD family nutrient uptake outer membrane protein [Parabacteroides hominis]
MKKIIIYLATMLLAAMTFTGCYDLETYPGDKVNEGTFYKTGDHAHQGLMGIYGMLRLNEAYGYQFCFDHLGDIAYGYNYYMMFLSTYTDRDGTIQNHWQTFYDGIHRVNTFIRSVKGMRGIITDEQIDEYVAEAKFLRAMFYFSLTDLFGGVPYYDESTNVNEEFMNLKQLRSSLEEVRAHILEDLDEAIKYLPVEHAASEYGRATKGAAYALRGKVHLYDKEWQSAINDFEEIVYNKSDNYGYALDDDYARVFKLYNGAKSPETVFSIQNKSGVGTEYGMQIQALMGCRGAYGSCWNNTVPSTQLVDMYEFKDGRPFNWDDIFPGYNAMSPDERKDLLSIEMEGGAIVGLREADTAKILSAYTCRDPRLMATVIVPYSHYMGNIGRTTNVDLIFALDHDLAGNANGGTIQNNAGWVSYLYRKFVTEGDQGGAISNRLHTPFAFPLIRFADVLLMLSEAYNEAGQLDKAVTEFNKVRARVGMPGLNSGPAWMAVNSKEQMAERIRKERAVELAGEGHRFSDLRRWGYEIARKVLDNVDAINIYGEPIYTHLFTERDMLWPIPGVERERNKELTQNPGW